MIDSLREDPGRADGRRDARPRDDTRLTLNAAETGHLVIATMHAATCIEAIQRIVSAFQPELQASVSAQLADSLVGVVAQRLRFRASANMLVPELEILMASSAMKGVLRVGQLFKLGTVMEGGGHDGSFSFARYQEWLDAKTDWSHETERLEATETSTPGASLPSFSPKVPKAATPAATLPKRPQPLAAPPVAKPKPAPTRAAEPVSRDGVLEIDDAEDPADVLAQLNRKSDKH